MSVKILLTDDSDGFVFPKEKNKIIIEKKKNVIPMKVAYLKLKTSFTNLLL